MRILSGCTLWWFAVAVPSSVALEAFSVNPSPASSEDDALHEAGCSIVAEKASALGNLTTESVTRECVLIFPGSAPRCPFLAEAMAMAANAGEKFDAGRFCAVVDKARFCSQTMRRLLRSEAVGDLAFGECMRSKRPAMADEKSCKRFQAMLAAGRDGAEIVDTLRPCYMLEMSVGAVVPEVAVPTVPPIVVKSGQNLTSVGTGSAKVVAKSSTSPAAVINPSSESAAPRAEIVIRPSGLNGFGGGEGDMAAATQKTIVTRPLLAVVRPVSPTVPVPPAPWDGLAATSVNGAPTASVRRSPAQSSGTLTMSSSGEGVKLQPSTSRTAQPLAVPSPVSDAAISAQPQSTLARASSGTQQFQYQEPKRGAVPSQPIAKPQSTLASATSESQQFQSQDSRRQEVPSQPIAEPQSTFAGVTSEPQQLQLQDSKREAVPTQPTRSTPARVRSEPQQLQSQESKREAIPSQRLAKPQSKATSESQQLHTQETRRETQEIRQPIGAQQPSVGATVSGGRSGEQAPTSTAGDVAATSRVPESSMISALPATPRPVGNTVLKSISMPSGPSNSSRPLQVGTAKDVKPSGPPTAVDPVVAKPASSDSAPPVQPPSPSTAWSLLPSLANALPRLAGLSAIDTTTENVSRTMGVPKNDSHSGPGPSVAVVRNPVVDAGNTNNADSNASAVSRRRVGLAQGRHEVVQVERHREAKSDEKSDRKVEYNGFLSKFVQ